MQLQKNKKQPQAHQSKLQYFLIVLISDRYVSYTALTEICRKDIRHPRPGYAPSLPVIGSIPGEDGAHPETGKKTRAANNILPAARSHYGMKKIISADFL